MVTSPLFSILLPTHSRIDVIQYAVQSVLNQTVTDFELLVVGDGCAPGTNELLQKFKDPRIRFFDLPKAPHFGYANRNIALKESRGKFIAFMADDDLIFPDHLEILQNGLKNGSALAYTQAIWVSTDGIAAPFLTNLEFKDELELFMLHHNSIPASCFAYRADALPVRDAWPEDVSSAADWRLWHKIIESCPDNPLTYCRIPTVLHFSAKWKQSRSSGMPALAGFLEIADNAAWWPSSLRLNIPTLMNEQSVYASRMQENPTSWPTQLRHDITDVINRIAWDGVNYLRDDLKNMNQLSEKLELDAKTNQETINKLSEQLNNHIAQISAQSNLNSKNHQQITKYKNELEEIRNSTCWKLTKPLRTLAEFFRK